VSNPKNADTFLPKASGLLNFETGFLKCEARARKAGWDDPAQTMEVQSFIGADLSATIGEITIPQSVNLEDCFKAKLLQQKHVNALKDFEDTLPAWLRIGNFYPNLKLPYPFGGVTWYQGVTLPPITIIHYYPIGALTGCLQKGCTPSDGTAIGVVECFIKVCPWNPGVVSPARRRRLSDGAAANGTEVSSGCISDAQFAEGLRIVSNRERIIWENWMLGVMKSIESTQVAEECAKSVDCVSQKRCHLCQQWTHYAWHPDVSPYHTPCAECGWLFGAASGAANQNRYNCDVSGLEMWGGFVIDEPGGEEDEGGEGVISERRLLEAHRRYEHHQQLEGTHDLLSQSSGPHRRLLAFDAAAEVLKAVIPGSNEDKVVDMLTKYGSLDAIKALGPEEFAHELADLLGIPAGQIGVAQKILDLLNGDFSSLSISGTGELAPQEWEFFSVSTTIPIIAGLNVYLEIGANGYFQIGYVFSLDGAAKLASGEIGPEIGFSLKGSAGLDVTVARGGIEIKAFLLMHELKAYAELKLDAWPLDVCAGVKRLAKPLDVSLRAWYEYYLPMEWQGRNYFDIADWAIPADGTIIEGTLFEICSVQPNQAPIATAFSITVLEDSAELKHKLRATDAEDDRLVFTIAEYDGPFQVTMTDVNTGTFKFGLKTNMHGSGAIIVSVSDGSLDSKPGVVSVTIEAVADTPKLAVVRSIGDEDTPFELQFSARVTDLDGSEEIYITVGDIPEGAKLFKNNQLVQLSSSTIDGTTSVGVKGGDSYYTLSPNDVANLRASVDRSDEPQCTTLCGDADYEPVCISNTTYYTPCEVALCAELTIGSHGPCAATGDVWSIELKEHDNGEFLLAITATAREMSNGDENSLQKVLRITARSVNDKPIVAGLQSLSVHGYQNDEDLGFGLTGVWISDVDGGTGPYRLRVETEHGIPVLTYAAGIEFSEEFENGVGNIVEATGPLARLNVALFSINYRPVPNFYGNDTFKIWVTDNGNSGLGKWRSIGSKHEGFANRLTPILNDTAGFSLRIMPVNDAPEMTGPGPQTLTEGQVLQLPRINVTDSDVEAGRVMVTIFPKTDSKGAVFGEIKAQSKISDVLAASDNGMWRASLQFLATIDEANEVLSKLEYRANNTAICAHAVTVNVDDQGNTGSPGPLQSSRYTGISLLMLNDPPKLAKNSSGMSVNEGQQLHLPAGLFIITDTDVGNGQMHMRLSTANGQIKCQVPSSTEATLSAQSWASEIHVYATIQGLHEVLANTSYWGGSLHWKGQDTLTIQVDDQGNTGFSDGIVTVTDSVIIDVVPVASLPSLFVGDAMPAESQTAEVSNSFWQTLTITATSDDPTEDVCVTVSLPVPGTDSADDGIACPATSGEQPKVRWGTAGTGSDTSVEECISGGGGSFDGFMLFMNPSSDCVVDLLVEASSKDGSATSTTSAGSTERRELSGSEATVPEAVRWAAAGQRVILGGQRCAATVKTGRRRKLRKRAPLAPTPFRTSFPTNNPTSYPTNDPTKNPTAYPTPNPTPAPTPIAPAPTPASEAGMCFTAGWVSDTALRNSDTNCGAAKTSATQKRTTRTADRGLGGRGRKLRPVTSKRSPTSMPTTKLQQQVSSTAPKIATEFSASTMDLLRETCPSSKANMCVTGLPRIINDGVSKISDGTDYAGALGGEQVLVKMDPTYNPSLLTKPSTSASAFESTLRCKWVRDSDEYDSTQPNTNGHRSPFDQIEVAVAAAGHADLDGITDIGIHDVICATPHWNFNHDFVAVLFVSYDACNYFGTSYEQGATFAFKKQNTLPKILLGDDLANGDEEEEDSYTIFVEEDRPQLIVGVRVEDEDLNEASAALEWLQIGNKAIPHRASSVRRGLAVSETTRDTAHESSSDVSDVKLFKAGFGGCSVIRRAITVSFKLWSVGQGGERLPMTDPGVLRFSTDIRRPNDGPVDAYTITGACSCSLEQYRQAQDADGSIDPASDLINAQLGLLEFTAPKDFVGTMYFSITADDGGHSGYNPPGHSSSKSEKVFKVVVKPINDAPEYMRPGVLSGTEGIPLAVKGLRLIDVDLETSQAELDAAAAIYADGTSESTAAVSCLQIKVHHPSSVSGTYFLRPDPDTAVISVFCDMVTGGGGWALLGVYSHHDPVSPPELFAGYGVPTNVKKFAAKDTSDSDYQHDSWAHPAELLMPPRLGRIEMSTTVQTATNGQRSGTGAQARTISSSGLYTYGSLQLPSASLLVMSDPELEANAPLQVRHKCLWNSDWDRDLPYVGEFGMQLCETKQSSGPAWSGQLWFWLQANNKMYYGAHSGKLAQICGDTSISMTTSLNTAFWIREDDGASLLGDGTARAGINGIITQLLGDEGLVWEADYYWKQSAGTTGFTRWEEIVSAEPESKTTSKELEGASQGRAMWASHSYEGNPVSNVQPSMSSSQVQSMSYRLSFVTAGVYDLWVRYSVFWGIDSAYSAHDMGFIPPPADHPFFTTGAPNEDAFDGSSSFEPETFKNGIYTWARIRSYTVR
jgi:hypothetical protein